MSTYNIIKKHGGYIDYSFPVCEMAIFIHKDNAEKAYKELQNNNADIADLSQYNNKYCFKVYM